MVLRRWLRVIQGIECDATQHRWVSERPKPGTPCACGEAWKPWPLDAQPDNGTCSYCGDYREDHPRRKCRRVYY